jgi:uncharacterized protein (UPF0147 family)
VRRYVSAVVVFLVVASAAHAQGRASSPEQRYCEALSDLYMRYVGNPETQPRNVRRNDADAEAALAQCRHGEPVASITVLERKLTDNKVTLPQRP